MESHKVLFWDQCCFLIYIKDLETTTEAGKPTTFADNTSIFIAGNNGRNVKKKNKYNDKCTHKLV
jgi:hypothetical protein